MVNALTASEASSQLGHLLDRAVIGKHAFLRRGNRLVRLAPVTTDATTASAKTKHAALRPFGYFKFDDALTALANRAEPSLHRSTQRER